MGAKKITVDVALLERARNLVYDAVHGYGIECNCGLLDDSCEGSCTRAELEDLIVTLTWVINGGELVQGGEDESES